MTNILYAIPSNWSGTLAILARPRGGDWLDSDVAQWEMLGINLVVSLLTPHEQDELDLNAEGRTVEQHKLRFLSLPIPDRSVPTRLTDVQQLATIIAEELLAGAYVGIHCRQGIGRSSLIAATSLITLGLSPAEAFDRIATARGCPVPDTIEQRQWVEQFAEHGVIRAA